MKTSTSAIQVSVTMFTALAVSTGVATKKQAIEGSQRRNEATAALFLREQTKDSLTKTRLLRSKYSRRTKNSTHNSTVPTEESKSVEFEHDEKKSEAMTVIKLGIMHLYLRRHPNLS